MQKKERGWDAASGGGLGRGQFSRSVLGHAHCTMAFSMAASLEELAVVNLCRLLVPAALTCLTEHLESSSR